MILRSHLCFELLIVLFSFHLFFSYGSCPTFGGRYPLPHLLQYHYNNPERTALWFYGAQKYRAGEKFYATNENQPGATRAYGRVCYSISILVWSP
ncbi:hypothetical protein TPHV1_150003 [Treponema phagedenis]|uniref:Uncharacterized protein n=1 Tax=Treponema phagedenis TaxID=162 RepID=A0A0B7GWV1_TREPH|nr:hypothetical protein TPHV1_150003 [Treponema phagedenis]